jgi:hypothetical protein
MFCGKIMNEHRKLFSALIILVAIWVQGAGVSSSELNPNCRSSMDPQPILGLLEYANSSEMEGNPILFALYSDRTVIYRDRKNRHGGFVTGKVDDEAWQMFEKIVSGLTLVKTNFAFTEAERQQTTSIIFKDGNSNRELSIYGPISVKKIGIGRAATYSTSEPAIKIISPSYSSGEVPQSVIGAWYETHYFVPTDVRKWEPDYFDAYLFHQETKGKNIVSWPANWPKLEGAKSEDYSNGHSIKLPGKYLAEFEKLFREAGTTTTIGGHTFVVSYTIPLPSEHQLLAAAPVGVNEPQQRKPLLPRDFLEKTNLNDVKKIARERAYEMHRIDSPASEGVNFVRSADVIEELCQSADSEAVDAGLELTIEAKRGPLRLASMIASTHSPESARALIVRHIADKKFLEVITPLFRNVS